MSAYSFVNHRMFVAALSNDAAASRPIEQYDPNSARTVHQADPASDFHPRPASPPMAGVLLANALMNGYQPAVS